MKKVEIETECGETSTIYVSQDVKKITVDGEEYAATQEEEETDKLPAEDSYIHLKELLEKILDVMETTDRNHWCVGYKTDEDKFEFKWDGPTLPNAVFQIKD